VAASSRKLASFSSTSSQQARPVERVPLCQQVFGPGLELCVLWDDAELFLVGENLIAQIVPAHVELALELLDPFWCRVMRRMGAAGLHIVAEERLVRRDRVELIQPGGIVGHGGGQVPARLADIGINRRGVAEEVALPLAGVAAYEAIEILESHAGRPLFEGPNLVAWNAGVL
jgi:hypothetical protein